MNMHVFAYKTFDTKFLYSSTVNYSTSSNEQSQEKIAEFIKDSLKGEFFYLQTIDGKIVSIHYGSLYMSHYR